jgi:curli biogenesis system outer membrane secretion channel CsgG
MNSRSFAPRLLVLLPIATVLLASSAFAEEPAGWQAFLRDKDGNQEPFPENAAQVKDKDWLRVDYTEYAGMKPRLGVVLSEETDVATRDYHSEWARLLSDIYGSHQGTNPLNHIEDLVRQSLSATHRFTMLERTNAKDDMIAEQDFGASGRVDKKTAAAIGKIKGAGYIVKATIIEINPEKETRDIKAVAGAMSRTGIGIGSVGVSGKVAFCRLNVRIIDSNTSEIVQDMTVDGTASSKGLSLGAGVLGAGSKILGGGGVSSTTKKQAPLSDAIQACANKIAYNVALQFEDAPWQGAIASVNNGKVIINAGTNAGLKPGVLLKVMSKGNEITDPETGESLGFEMSEVGKIRIVTVQEKFSTCEVLSGCEAAQKGDMVQVGKE